MDARCTGCGGRVMPYRQYILHFRPTAVCESCGGRVRMRHFRTVMLTAVVVGAVFTVLLLRLAPPALALAGLALAALAGLLADFWTFRNLPWDPVEADAATVDGDG